MNSIISILMKMKDTQNVVGTLSYCHILCLTHMGGVVTNQLLIKD